MHDNLARTISTVAIWLGVTVILTFGVFGVSWTDAVALFFMFLVVGVICAAAAFSTAAIWGKLSEATASVRELTSATKPAE